MAVIVGGIVAGILGGVDEDVMGEMSWGFGGGTGDRSTTGAGFVNDILFNIRYWFAFIGIPQRNPPGQNVFNDILTNGCVGIHK